MKTITLQFDAAGDGHCFYTEEIDLSALGVLHITRASNIEFNPSKQEWEVKNTAGKRLYSHTSRQTCLDWEHQHFNQ